MTLLDIIELYNINNGNELYDVMALYEDIVLDERLDKDVLVNVIVEECGASDVMFETTVTFKRFSDVFFMKYAENIKKLVDSMEFKYDPLVNKSFKWTETTKIEQNLDTEQIDEMGRTRENTGTQQNKGEGSVTVNETGTQKTDDTGTQKNDAVGNQENTISAMNSSGYQSDNMRDTTSTNTRTDNLSSLRTDNLQNKRTDDTIDTRVDDLKENINSNKTMNKGEELSWDEIDTHTEDGTINVAFQDLIEKERKLAEFNIYNWIVNRYRKELFLLVY